jgi:hypothetical protein
MRPLWQEEARAHVRNEVECTLASETAVQRLRYRQRGQRALRALGKAVGAVQGERPVSVTAADAMKAYRSVKKPSYNGEGWPGFEAHLQELVEAGDVTMVQGGQNQGQNQGEATMEGGAQGSAPDQLSEESGGEEAPKGRRQPRAKKQKKKAALHPSTRRGGEPPTGNTTQSEDAAQPRVTRQSAKAQPPTEEEQAAELQRAANFILIEDNLLSKVLAAEMRKVGDDFEKYCCECPPATGAVFMCSGRCESAGMKVECGKELDEDGGYCANQRLHRGEVAEVEIKQAVNGLGCFILEAAREGQLLLEYKGEYRRREAMRGVQRYTLEVIPGVYLDAEAQGGWARFINHSCAPNAEFERWLVRGAYRVGVFARCKLVPGEEITVDYNLESLGGTGQECNCGSGVCRRAMTAPPSKGAKKRKAAPAVEQKQGSGAHGPSGRPPAARCRGCDAALRGAGNQWQTCRGCMVTCSKCLEPRELGMGGNPLLCSCETMSIPIQGPSPRATRSVRMVGALASGLEEAVEGRRRDAPRQAEAAGPPPVPGRLQARHGERHRAARAERSAPAESEGKGDKAEGLPD